MVDANTQTTPCFQSQLSTNENTVKKDIPVKHNEKERDDAIDFDPAIVSIGRANDNQVPGRVFFLQLFHSPNKQSDDLFYTFKLINVVDQMIAQPHISYSLLPKHFKPKLFTKSNDSHHKDPNQRYQQNSYRSMSSTNSYHRSHTNRWYPQYSAQTAGDIKPFHDIPKSNSYYRQNRNDCIRDNHRINTVIPPSWKDKQIH